MIQINKMRKTKRVASFYPANIQEHKILKITKSYKQIEAFIQKINDRGNKVLEEFGKEPNLVLVNKTWLTFIKEYLHQNPNYFLGSKNHLNMSFGIIELKEGITRTFILGYK